MFHRCIHIPQCTVRSHPFSHPSCGRRRRCCCDSPTTAHFDQRLTPACYTHTHALFSILPLLFHFHYSRNSSNPRDSPSDPSSTLLCTPNSTHTPLYPTSEVPHRSRSRLSKSARFLPVSAQRPSHSPLAKHRPLRPHSSQRDHIHPSLRLDPTLLGLSVSDTSFISSRLHSSSFNRTVLRAFAPSSSSTHFLDIGPRHFGILTWHRRSLLLTFISAPPHHYLENHASLYAHPACGSGSRCHGSSRPRSSATTGAHVPCHGEEAARQLGGRLWSSAKPVFRRRRFLVFGRAVF